MNSDNDKISRVYRSKDEAAQAYSRMSKTYDLFAGFFEGKYRDIALSHLNIKTGEEVLEIGFGTGQILKQTAILVGETGKIYGIDISSGMLEVAEKRLSGADLMDRVELICGDSSKIPYEDSMFDAVFISFTLELFDSPEIPIVLNEIKRVLKPKGRFAVVSLSKDSGETILLKLYEWAHMKFPKYIDCRPIYLEESILDAGFDISYQETLKLSGLPVKIVLAQNP
jgi:ubiquinone/menaquinone biosynthesis C-methylase UbiE